MSNDQKIMDKFFEQTQEILVLKGAVRTMGFVVQNLESKLKIAVEALNIISNDYEMNHSEIRAFVNKAIKEIEGSIEKK